MRLLGVTIDSCLSWDAHIGQIIKKCNAILISLYRFRHHFNQETLKLLIETHVFPHILYCISVWGGAAKNQLFRIQKVINFGARIVLGVRRRDRIGPALASLGWARIEQLVREKDLLKIYKALHYQLYPLSIRRMFTPRSMDLWIYGYPLACARRRRRTCPRVAPSRLCSPLSAVCETSDWYGDRSVVTEV